MMDSDGGLIYGLEYQCRSLCAVEAETEKIQFLVGTQGLKNKLTNQVHLLEVDEESRTMVKTIFNHPAGEVWDLAACPADPDLFLTRHSCIDNNVCKMEATIWSKSEDGAADDNDDEQHQNSSFSSSSNSAVRDLRPVCSLDVSDNGGGDVNCAAWMPGGGEVGKVLVLAENRLTLHDVSRGGSKSSVVTSGKLEGKGQTNLTTGTWNPHQNCQQFSTANDHHVRGWDVRVAVHHPAFHFENPGHNVVRTLDFNPNKQYHMATAGDDGTVRFWDIRQTNQQLGSRSDHSHWIWTVKFNQFHDELILTSSSDCHVILSCMASISSEPHGHLVDDDEGGEDVGNVLEDGVIKTFEDHEESVYAAAWSSADPWTFASISYDGRMVVNQVPRDVKFKILNLV
jgi:WD40 repeat protein